MRRIIISLKCILQGISYFCGNDFGIFWKGEDMRWIVFLFILSSCTNTKNAIIKNGLYVTHKPGFIKANYEYYINNNYMSYNDTLKIFKDNKYEINLRFVISYGTYKIKSDRLILISDSTFWVAKNEMTYKNKLDTVSKYETFIIKNDETIIRNSTFRFCDDDSYENKRKFEFEFVRPLK